MLAIYYLPLRGKVDRRSRKNRLCHLECSIRELTWRSQSPCRCFIPITHANPHRSFMRWLRLPFPFYGWGNWGTKTLSNFNVPNHSGRAGIQTQAAWLQSLYATHCLISTGRPGNLPWTTQPPWHGRKGRSCREEMRIPAPNPTPVLPLYSGASSVLLPAPPAQMARREGSVLN